MKAMLGFVTGTFFSFTSDWNVYENSITLDCKYANINAKKKRGKYSMLVFKIFISLLFHNFIRPFVT